MSKVVMALPKGMGKNCVVGGAIALGAYAALQMLCALLIHREVVSMDMLYPMVCITAAVASFLGCAYSILRGGSASMLTVSVVVVVFLTLTLAVAFFSADSIAVDNGLTGVGLCMAAGGLLAALVGPAFVGKKSSNGKSRGRKKRRRA